MDPHLSSLALLVRCSVIALALAFACAPKYVIPHDGLYDSQLPAVTAESRRVFDRLFAATVKVTWTPEYRTTHYHHDLDRKGKPFSDPASPTGFRLLRGEAGIVISRDAHSVVGSGVLIARRATGTGLDAGVVLTVAHVVTAPDTMRSYLWDEQGQPTGVLTSISVKTSDFVFITGRGGVHAGAAVRKVDREQDLALLTASIPATTGALEDFSFRVGDSSALDWGTLTYLLGYPHGQAQLTWGIVSPGAREGDFQVAATVNLGYSGGPVIAIRDGLPNVELVGLCKWASTNNIRYIAPNDMLGEGVRMTPRLIEETVVKEARQIEYGTAFVVPINVIRKFVLGAREVFAEKGIDVLNYPSLRGWGF
ncbi:MAG: serine protease [Candidatus Latescibacteria bacterium]|nr:serine protease [Candidatus Latescibacterota bacterium]